MGLDGFNAEIDGYIELKPSYLREYFSNHQSFDTSFIHQHSRTKDELDTNESYLRLVESDPDWEGSLYGYLTNPAAIYETRKIEYTPESESVLIHLVYQIQPQTNK